MSVRHRIQVPSRVWAGESMRGSWTGGVQGRLIDESDYPPAVSVFRHDNYRRQVMRPATDRRSPLMMYVTYASVWQAADLAAAIRPCRSHRAETLRRQRRRDDYAVH